MIRLRSILLVSTLVWLVAACGIQEAREVENDQQRIESFCVQNPQRDFGMLFRLVSESGANPGPAKDLMQFAVKGLQDPPSEIKADVEVVTEKLVAVNGDQAGADDPAVKAAIERINAWMLATCGPPTVSVGSQPGTTR